jgi:outer membrane protein assembly factor BamB
MSSTRHVATVSFVDGLTLVDGHAWMGSVTSGPVVELDLETGGVTPHTVVDANGVRHNSGPMAVEGDGAVWVTSPPDAIARIDLATGVVEVIPVGVEVTSIAYSSGRVFAVGVPGSAIALDTRTHGVVHSRELGSGDWRVVSSESGTALLDRATGRLVRVGRDLELAGDRVVAPHAGAIAVGEGAIWVADDTNGLLLAIDPATGAVLTAVNVSVSGRAVAVGDGVVWVVAPDGIVQVALR